MKKLLIIAILVFSPITLADVQCTQFGVINGPIVTFPEHCPLGWMPA